MNIKLFLITYFTMITFCIAQEDIKTPPREIFIGSFGSIGENETVIYYMEAVSTVWARKEEFPKYTFPITSKFNQAQYSTIGINDPPQYRNWWGFEWNPEGDGGGVNFSYGIYIVRPYKKDGSLHSDAYFYLDYRHFLYPSRTYEDPYDPYLHFCCGDDNDLWIKYEFNYSQTTGHFSYSQNWDQEFTPITQGETVSIWNLKQAYPVDALIIFGNKGKHPVLQWGPHPIFNIPPYFEIYRAVVNRSDYSKIGQTNNNTYFFTDNDVLIDDNGDYISYYVKKMVQALPLI